MRQYDSMQELANKIDHEGGLYNFLQGFGLAREQLPSDAPEYFYMDLMDLTSAFQDFRRKRNDFMGQLPEPSDE